VAAANESTSGYESFDLEHEPTGEDRLRITRTGSTYNQRKILVETPIDWNIGTGGMWKAH